MSELIDKLQIEVSSYQESFQLLSKARNLKELAKSFFHTVSGNLMVTKINIYYNKKHDDDWQPLFIKDDTFDFQACTRLRKDKINYLDDAHTCLFLTLSMVDGSSFALMLGRKLGKKAYDEFDQITIQRLGILLDNAYQVYLNKKKEKDLIFSLNQRVLQLNSLVDTGIEISRLDHGSGILELALNRVISLTNASKGILVVTEKNRVMNKIYFPTTFKERTLEKNGHLIASKFKFHGKTYSLKLFDKESRRGLIAFDDTDQLLLDSFARQVNVTLENHFLHEEALEKQRIEQDVTIAATIQQRIIPEKLPDIEGYDLAGINIASKQVGGDYYDCFALKDGRYALVMADVSGKGIPAGLLVSTLQASLHAYLDSPFKLTDLVQKLNVVIFKAATIEKYITAFFAILDPKTGELEAVNAGHNPTYIIRGKNSLEELKTGGIPLGMMGLPFPYTSKSTVINPGDRLVLYTDGVTEAMNENEEEFDDVIGFEKYVKKNARQGLRAQAFIDQLIKDIDDFTGSTPQSDDITAFYLLRSSE
ncbi:MAG: PP2C family protein-serine/threonine phosphatase [Calditrichaceae bacterium]